MGISDILAMLGGSPAMAQGQPPQPQGALPPGVGAFLGGDTDPGAQDQATPASWPTADRPQAPQQAAPAPVTPPSDAGAGGLSGFLSHMVHKATTADPNTGMSFMDRLGRVGGFMTDSMGDTRGAEKSFVDQGAANLAAARRAKLQQMADGLGMSPREKLIFTADPEKWTEASAKNLEPATVPGGATRVTPGAPAYSAPVYGQEKGEGYSITPEGMKDQGGLAMSPAQAAEAQAKEASQKAIEYYHRMMIDIGRQNADAHMISATRPRVGAGGGGGSPNLPPGY